MPEPTLEEVREAVRHVLVCPGRECPTCCRYADLLARAVRAQAGEPVRYYDDNGWKSNDGGIPLSRNLYAGLEDDHD